VNCEGLTGQLPNLAKAPGGGRCRGGKVGAKAVKLSLRDVIQGSYYCDAALWLVKVSCAPPKMQMFHVFRVAFWEWFSCHFQGDLTGSDDELKELYSSMTCRKHT
jgi:hypothetical protein